MASAVKTDCRNYQGGMPCIVHKKTGITCEHCSAYDAIKTRIPIIKLGAIGDVLRTTSILPALLHKYSSAEITWITKANTHPYCKAIRGLIDCRWLRTAASNISAMNDSHCKFAWTRICAVQLSTALLI